MTNAQMAFYILTAIFILTGVDSLALLSLAMISFLDPDPEMWPWSKRLSGRRKP